MGIKCTVFFNSGLRRGLPKISCIKPHQATHHFDGLGKRLCLAKTRTFISVQNKMVPVWNFDVFYEANLWEFLYTFLTNKFGKAIPAGYWTRSLSITSSSAAYLGFVGILTLLSEIRQTSNRCIFFWLEIKVLVFTMHYIFLKPLKSCSAWWGCIWTNWEQPPKRFRKTMHNICKDYQLYNPWYLIPYKIWTFLL